MPYCGGFPQDYRRPRLGIGSESRQARGIAQENRRGPLGGDSLKSRRDAQATYTFEEAARKVHAIHAPLWRKARHAAQFISTLGTYAFPRLGEHRVPDITTADVLAALQPIWLEKPETARRVRQRIGTVMKWAVAQGWRQDNPAESISSALPRQSRVQRHRKAMPYGEVGDCLKVVRASKASPFTKLALELLVVTACRSGEVRLANWSEMDLDRAVWTIPGERMKAGREHRVPLSEQAVALLRQAQALGTGSGLVFPGAKAGRPLSDMTLAKLVKELGFDVDVHGFRTSFKTWAQEQTNAPREVSEAALAHVIRDKAEAAYARSDLFEKRRELMQQWTEFLRSG